jgi:hypothetical protein
VRALESPGSISSLNLKSAAKSHVAVGIARKKFSRLSYAVIHAHLLPLSEMTVYRSSKRILVTVCQTEKKRRSPRRNLFSSTSFARFRLCRPSPRTAQLL